MRLMKGHLIKSLGDILRKLNLWAREQSITNIRSIPHNHIHNTLKKYKNKNNQINEKTEISIKNYYC